MTSAYVEALMEALRDGRPKTLYEIAAITGCPKGILPETYRSALSFHANRLYCEGVLDRTMSGRKAVWKLREVE